MSEAVLYHYGVKGMKWGVRRPQAQLDRAAGRRAKREAGRNASKTKTSSTKGYSDNDKRTDRANFGQRGANRIEKRVAQGRTRDQARRSEHGREAIKALLGTGLAAGVLAGPAVAEMTYNSLAEATQKKKAENGAKATAAMFSDRMGIADHSVLTLSPDDYEWV